MLARRSMVAGGACLLLAACAEPLVQSAQTGPLFVTDVSVTTGEVERITGRDFVVTPEGLQSDIESAVRGGLVGRGQPDGRPVRVRLPVESVRLVSPGQSIWIGGVSTIRGRLEVVDARSGEVVIPGTAVVGTGDGYAGGGLVGAVMRPPPAQDYRNVVGSFAEDVRVRLFGRRSTRDKIG